MAMFVLAQEKILPRRAFPSVANITRRFFELPHRGIAIYIFLISMGVGFAVYLGALYDVFQTGFEIRNRNVELNRIRAEVASLELKIQTGQTELARDTGVVETMEKISSLRYLTPESVVTSETTLNP